MYTIYKLTTSNEEHFTEYFQKLSGLSAAVKIMYNCTMGPVEINDMLANKTTIYEKYATVVLGLFTDNQGVSWLLTVEEIGVND
jgi:hypothetical protein